ncbi:MAG: hypothetical protein ACJ77K_00325 [Bacteroidia bacterium]
MFKISQLFILLLLAGSIHSQEITATQKIPANALPGTDFIVETTINKGASHDFMKFFQALPAGFTAADIESKGGAFTFADGGAKIVWISPPADPVFTISYRVTVGGGMSGPQNMPAKISYIMNSERKAFEMEATIMIGTAGTPLNKTLPTTNPVVSTEPAKTEPPKTEPVKTEPVKTSDNIPTVVKTTPPPVQEKKDPAQPTTFNKVPVTALPASAGRTYKVQIGAFSQKPTIDGVPQMSTFVLDNGITKYFSGNFPTYEDAVKRKKEMLDKGFQGAFIVAFENGKPIK